MYKYYLIIRDKNTKAEICRGSTHQALRYQFKHGSKYEISVHRHVLKYYTFYARDTDELLCSGTIKECAAALGLTERAIYSIAEGHSKKYEVYSEEYDPLENNIDDA